MNVLEKNLKVFIKILELTQDRDYPIILSGSTSLSMQGVDIEVHDIDIVTDKKGAFTLANRLKEYQVKEMAFSKTDKYKSYFGKYRIDDVDIDIMGDFQYKTKNNLWSEKNHLHPLKQLEYKKHKISFLALEQELIEYESANKTITISKIKEKLNKEKIIK